MPAAKATQRKPAPAKRTAAPKPVLVSIPKLAKGEAWAGIMLLNGRPHHHVILLPEELLDIDWKQSMAWAKKQHKDGRLPTPSEQCLLRANLPEQFKPRAYWSGTHSAYNSSWAWCQSFSNGYQDDYYGKSLKLACRAVRSEAI